MPEHRLKLLVAVPFIGLLFAGGDACPDCPDRSRPGTALAPVHEGTALLIRKQTRFGARLDSLLRDSARPKIGSYQAALRAAEVDPGIVLFPDTTVDAKIRTITPPRAVDPEMIVPKWGPQSDPE